MRKIYILLVIFICLQLAPIVSYAGQDVFQDIANQTKEVRKAAGYSEPTTDTGPITAYIQHIVGKIIKATLGLLGTIFLILLIYSGYLWMTAGGEEEEVTKAKTLLRNAIIGIIIVVAAGAITQFIIQRVSESTEK